MTISNTDDPVAGPFEGDDSQTEFPFTFKVFATTDLDGGVVALIDDVQETLVLGSDYSVTLNADQNANPGGTLTYPLSGSPLATGNTLTISSNLTDTQPSSIPNRSGFYARVVENALDRNVMLLKQAKAGLSRSLRFPLADFGVDTELPIAADRALKQLTFDADGNPVCTAPVAGTADALAAALLDPDDGGASMVAWKQLGTGAANRFSEDKLREIVSWSDYIQDGDTSDSDAIDRAIAYAVTRSVAGVTSAIGIKITDDCVPTRSHVISDDYIVIYGEGRFTSTIAVSTAFRVFDFKKADGSTLYYSGVANLGFRATSGANLASGAFVRFYNVSGGFVDNCHMQGWYVGVELTGAARCFFTRLSCSQAGRTSGQGLAGISIGGDATAGISTGNHITDYECYSTAGISAPYVHGILVTGSDGLYITNAHMTEGENDLTIAPDNSTNNDVISSIELTNVYMDACTSHALWMKGTCAATGKYRDIKLVNCQMRGADSTMVLIDPSSSSSKIRMLKFLGCSFRMSQVAAVSFASDNVQGAELAHCDFDDNNITNGASGHDVIVRGEGVSVNNCNFNTGSATGDCIFVASTATKFRIEHNDYSRSTRTTFLTNSAGANAGYRIRDNIDTTNVSIIEETKTISPTTDATTTTLWSYTLGQDESVVLDADVEGSHISFTNHINARIQAMAYRDGAAAAALVGAATPYFTALSTGGTLAVVVELSGNILRIRVTGIAATTMHWFANVRAVLRGV